MKSFKEFSQNKELSEQYTSVALSIAQRLKKSRMFKRFAAKIKLGKNIANVDINEYFKASFIPPTENPALYPIKLVINKTGPGVIWLIIIPSINSLFVNHPCEIT